MKNIYQENCHCDTVNTEAAIVIHCLPDSGNNETLGAVDQADLGLIEILKGMYHHRSAFLFLFFLSFLFYYLFTYSF